MKRRISKFSTLLGAQQHLPEIPDSRSWSVIEKITSYLELMDFTNHRAKRYHEIIQAKHRKYGPVYRDRIGFSSTAVFVNSANAIQQIFMREGKYPMNFVPPCWSLYNDMRKRKRGLLFMQGEEWHHYRKILNKTLLDKSAANFMIKPCREAAMSLSDKWKDYVVKNQTIPNLEHQLYQWSTEVVLASMVGTTWPSYHRRILPRLENLSRVLTQIFDLTHKIIKYPHIEQLIVRLPWWRDLVKALDNALEAVDVTVDEMSELEGAENGLLRRMMDEGIEKSMLKGIIGDLIVAAGDTTAVSMQWLIYLLAKNLDSQEKLAERLRGLDTEQILHEPLLRGAIKESFRLYPIAHVITRILPEDALIEGYPVNKGEMVAMSFYSSSRDDKNFPEANAFVPERWLKNNKGASMGVINHHASLPFAMGARSCVGKRLAEIQISLTTAELLKHFVIDCENKDNVRTILRMIPVPSEPLKLRLTPRR